MPTYKTLFLIPARGGSKGIPDKNIRPFLGQPLILRSVATAREFADDADICVSTDSPKIAEIVRKSGLDIPFLRPAELASDTSGSYEVMLHALDYYKSNGRDYDRLVLLQPTSPLRTSDDVRRCLELYTPECDMVVSVRPAATNPYYNAYETDNNGYLHISKGDGHYTRRQDAPQVWEYTGSIYVINTQSLRERPMSAFTRRIPCEMDKIRSVDLDTPLDWLIAETLASQSAE